MRTLLVFSLCAAASFAADLKSAGVLAFGPDGVLFVGDSMGGSVHALETGDNKSAKAAPLEVKGLNEKLAAMLGTTADQILINDVAVNPASKNAYVSVSRGRGPEASALIFRVTPAGKIEEFRLDSAKSTKVMLPNLPAADAKDRRGQPLRQEAITDLAYVDGKVIVAGLSNEEFASNLRSIPYPFAKADSGASVEIYHGQHGRYETASPVRTFLPYKVNGEEQILAAYTCTPIVKFPVNDLKPGKKVMGKTIAELGNRNRPLDMVVYKKDGQEFILMNNSSRGVMKLPTAKMDSYAAITSQTEKAGIPYETIESLKGVQQLDLYGDQHAMILVSEGSSLDLKTIGLP